MSTRRIPLLIGVSAASDFAVPSFPAVNLTVGYESDPIRVNYTPGSPPVTDAQLQQGRIEFFTDAARTNRMGEDDEALYRYTITPVDGQDAFDLIFNLEDVPSVAHAQLYADLVVEQG